MMPFAFAKALSGPEFQLGYLKNNFGAAMSFAEVNGQFFDPVRKCSLRYLRNNKEGLIQFVLNTPEEEFYFNALSYGQSLPPDYLSDRQLDPEKIVVWTVSNWTEQWKPTIAAALIAFKEMNGKPSDKLAFVRFGSEKEIYDGCS